MKSIPARAPAAARRECHDLGLGRSRRARWSARRPAAARGSRQSAPRSSSAGACRRTARGGTGARAAPGRGRPTLRAARAPWLARAPPSCPANGSSVRKSPIRRTGLIRRARILVDHRRGSERRRRSPSRRCVQHVIEPRYRICPQIRAPRGTVRMTARAVSGLARARLADQAVRLAGARPRGRRRATPDASSSPDGSRSQRPRAEQRRGHRVSRSGRARSRLAEHPERIRP